VRGERRERLQEGSEAHDGGIRERRSGVAWRDARGRAGRVRVLDLVVCFLYPYFLPFIAFSFFVGPGLKTETERGGNFFPVLDTRREGNKGRDKRER
jgi:hypothetical protein